MNKLILALASSAIYFNALAANTIRFEGAIANQTCQVDVNGEQSPVILLPTIPADEMDRATGVVGQQDIYVNLRNCESGQDIEWGVALVGNYVNPNGDLGNTAADGAKGVALRVTDKGADARGINFNDSHVVVRGKKIAAGDTQARHVLSVGYVKEQGVTHVEAGRVSGSMQYAINYF